MKYALAASAILAAGAVAQSDLTCAGTGVTVVPTAVEYPVYISTYISAATVFNINGNANITINNAPTTLEIFTTGTSTVYSTVTATTTVLASATPSPTATTVDEPIILAINNAALKHKRQAGASGFLGGSAGVAATCGEAVVLSLTAGSLFVNATGEQFSTTPGVTQMDFMPSGSVGSITTTFGLRSGFVWDNPAFVGGSASFCLSAGGIVQGLFSNSTPVDCTAISFTAVLASSCNNGTSSSSSGPSSSPTSSSSSNSTAPPTSSMTSSSSTSSTSSSNSTSSTSSTVTGVTTAVQVSFPSPTSAAKNKRQEVTNYLMADGTFTPDQSQAATFAIIDGEFFAAGSLIFSANADTPYEVFAGSDTVGDITLTFDLESGALVWTNESFTVDADTTAVFAISSSTLYAAFQTIPPGATTVALSASVVPASDFQPGSTTSASASASVTDVSSSTTTGSSPASGSASTGSASATVTPSTGSSSMSVTSSSTSSTVSSTPSASGNGTRVKRYNGMARLHPRN